MQGFELRVEAAEDGYSQIRKCLLQHNKDEGAPSEDTGRKGCAGDHVCILEKNLFCMEVEHIGIILGRDVILKAFAVIRAHKK